MSEEKKTAIGLHLLVVDKVVQDVDSLKQLEDTIQKYNGIFVSNWALKINQYRQKEDEQKPKTTKQSTTISLIYSSSLDGYVLISGKSNAIIADKAISIVYTRCLGYLTNTYSLKVEGKEYKINDIIIRFGIIKVDDRMQGAIVIDFEYLPSGSSKAFRILDSIRYVIHPQGRVVSSPFYELLQRKAMDIPNYTFKDLAQSYAGIIDTFKLK